jgi:hypothetical protein
MLANARADADHSQRQKFCGSRCAQRVRTSRFRKKHADQVSDMRHAAYAKRQRAKFPKAKVGRRKRKR